MDIKTSSLNNHRQIVAFLFAIPIAILGGMIGLGGAEFRLPVLAGPLHYPVKRAVPLNLAVSLVTIASALVIRSRAVFPGSVLEHWQIVASLILGAIVTAFWGATLAHRFSDRQFERVILILLLSIGLLLILEAFLPQSGHGFLPSNWSIRISAGMFFGLVIGLVSSLLGVAGGELIIPTLLFAYGMDIKTAGTLSLAISLPTVLVGLARYARQGVFTEHSALLETVTPMGIGSIIGAAVGGVLVGIVSPVLLKTVLGFVLIFSALRIFYQTWEKR